MSVGTSFRLMYASRTFPVVMQQCMLVWKHKSVQAVAVYMLVCGEPVSAWLSYEDAQWGELCVLSELPWERALR